MTTLKSLKKNNLENTMKKFYIYFVPIKSKELDKQSPDTGCVKWARLGSESPWG